MSFLQMSLHGAVMIAVITILRALTLNQVPKKTFLVLWALALVRLLVPFSLPSRLSVYTLLARQAPAVSDATAVSPPPVLRHPSPSRRRSLRLPRQRSRRGRSSGLWALRSVR